MPFNPITTELTTAATDLLLALAALGCAILLWRRRHRDAWKATLWTAIFGALVIGSTLAAVAHGLVIPARLQTGIWVAIYLALGLVVAGFAVAAVTDLAGAETARAILKLMALLVLLFLLAVMLMGGDFAPFILFEALCLLFALAVYVRLGWAGGRRDARWLALGLVLTLLAAALQALRLGAFVCVWPFDHNGAFHLLQMVALLPIAVGLRTGLRGA